MRDPTFEVKRERSISKDPLAVIFAGNMDVRTGYAPAFAGGITNRVACLHLFA
jgi:hypothetical protein